ncbi:MAG: hypothetical protein ACSHX0_09755 [Akkermansiaceae bacterium]
MKKTILLYTLATAGLALIPLHADSGAAKPATEEQAVSTVSAYIVQVSGKG